MIKNFRSISRDETWWGRRMASIQTFLERIANNYSPEKSTFSECGWKYFFVVPMIFSGVITICFIFVAWIAGKP